MTNRFGKVNKAYKVRCEMMRNKTSEADNTIRLALTIAEVLASGEVSFEMEFAGGKTPACEGCDVEGIFQAMASQLLKEALAKVK